MTHEIQKFVPRILILLEDAVHGTGNGYRILLFHAPHDHAEMLRLDDNGDPARVNLFVDRFRDLGRQPLLNLKPPGVHVDQPWNFAQADHAAVRNVPDMAFAEKWKQVMLAEAEKLNVADDDHLVISDI